MGLGAASLSGCGGQAEHPGGAGGALPGDPQSAGSSGLGSAAVAGGAAGSLAMGNAGAGATGECDPGTVRCNAQFERERCDENGHVQKMPFTCARNVAVDDETGGYCVTKADGTYRCLGGNVGEELPPARYVRVQATAKGLVGLTESGELVAAEMQIAAGLPPAQGFRATNMWGNPAVCPLFRDGTFGVSLDRSAQNSAETTPQFSAWNGSFNDAFCAYEGLRAGVRSDGSIAVGVSIEPPVGNDWRALAFSNSIFCALDGVGAIACVKANLSCEMFRDIGCLGSKLPSFAGIGYRSLTAGASSVCALTERGALVCQRYDGLPLLEDAGPYVFAEAGQSVVCAIGVDGAATCFRHAGDSALISGDVRQFERIDSPFGPGW